jgi:hypothetical protein
MYIGIVLCVLIVFSLHQESLKLIPVDEPLPEGVLSHGGTATTSGGGLIGAGAGAWAAVLGVRLLQNFLGEE